MDPIAEANGRQAQTPVLDDLREGRHRLGSRLHSYRSECLSARARSPLERDERYVGSGTTLAALAGRLYVLVQRDLLVRVDRAQVRTAAVERRLDLLLGERGSALGALALDHRLHAFALLEVHQISLPITWVTGRPVAAPALRGRSRCNHFDSRSGRVDTINSSYSPKLHSSWMAASGSGSPTFASTTFRPSSRSSSTKAWRCCSASSPPACMSAAQASPCGVDGTSSVNAQGPCTARARSASRSSGDSAVRLATTSTLAIGRRLSQ